jgi:hypothetical protein
VWRDSNGALISPVGGGRRETQFFFDERGFLWQVDRTTAQLYTSKTQSFHDAANCTGNAYVSALLPREVFTVEGEPAGTFRALPDTFTQVAIQPRSIRRSTGCENIDPSLGVELPLVSLAGSLPATPIVEPTVQFVPPIQLSFQ